MMLKRVVTAAGLLLVIALITAAPVAACSMVFPAVRDVLAGADLVFEGKVTAVHGGRMTVDVEIVYRGDVATGPMEIGSDEPSSCAVSAEPGQTVVVATDLLEQLDPAGVWWVLDDGTIGTLAPEPPAANADGLRAMLTGLPDTSMKSPTDVGIPAGVALMLTAAIVAIGQRLRKDRL